MTSELLMLEYHEAYTRNFDVPDLDEPIVSKLKQNKKKNNNVNFTKQNDNNQKPTSSGIFSLKF